MRQYNPVFYPPRPKPEPVEEPELITGAKFPDESRSHADLRLITYSGYSRQSANTQLYKQLEHGDYETAFYWGAELMGAGHWEDIWDVLIHYAAIHVYVGNILLPNYLWARLCIARRISEQDKNTLDYRNRDDFRQLIAEVIAVTLMSKKNPPIPILRIKRENELRIEILTSKLEATESHIDAFFQPKDPVELKVPLNELAHHLKHSRHNTMHACYWVEWILEFERKCRANKNPLEISGRAEYDVPFGFATDVVWLIWDALAHALSCVAKESPGFDIKTGIFRTLLSLFCYHYSRTAAKKKRTILYFVITILAADSFPDEPLVKDPALWEILKEQLHKTYNTLQPESAHRLRDNLVFFP